MRTNTTYKAFVAETSAKIAAEISTKYTMSYLSEAGIREDIAEASVKLADKLAEKLEEWWRDKGDHKTVMFDPDDTLLSGVEGELGDIADQLAEIKEQTAKMCSATAFQPKIKTAIELLREEEP